jgi:signal transduction histidine kinase/ligand-binding sensor domain-containing protein
MKTQNEQNSWRQRLMLCTIILALPQPVQNLLAQNPARGVKFERLSREQGLSQSSVLCIRQDRQGFMWFGTNDGLNRYDGYNFAVYKHDVLDSNSLSDSRVSAICEDSASPNTLWIGTLGGGLNKFDREKEHFTRFVHDPKTPRSLSHNSVWSIHEDRAGALWIGTQGGGLNKLDREKGQFIRFVYDPNNPHSLSHNHILAIYEDRAGTLWIGTNGGGLNQFDRENEQFIRYVNDPKEPQSLSHNHISAIYEDHAGALWVGTLDGLNQFDREKKQFIRFGNDPKNPHSLSHNHVLSIHEDRAGTLWIGTKGGGLNQFDREKKQFLRFGNDPKNLHSLSDNVVVSLYCDASGILWIGTEIGGLNKLDRDKERFDHVAHDPNNPNGLNNNTVMSIYEDRAGALWIGTWGGGLNKLDRERRQFSRYINDPKNPHSLGSNLVFSIYEVSLATAGNTLWIGTFGGGLNKFEREKAHFTRYVNDPNNPQSLSDNNVWSIYASRNTLWIGTYSGGLNKLVLSEGEGFTRYANDPNKPNSLSHNLVSSIYEDHAGTLWIGTGGGGLNQFNREKEQFIRYVNDPSNPHSLSHNMVFSIYETSLSRHGRVRRTLWIGTGGGLNEFDVDSGRFTRYTEKDGLPNNVILAILEDRSGRLWLSTNKGISCFDPSRPAGKNFRNYDVSDGLQSNEFNASAYHKSRRGEMFFGGINGFNVFHPDSIQDNPYPPPVVITAFKRYNTDDAEGIAVNEKGISAKQAITLSYKDNVLAFEFAALSYRNNFKNQYAYKLEGFNDNWIQLGTKRDITFTNLDPGKYILRVKASNNDGVWNEQGAALHLIITPPWWRTRWAYAIYALAVMAGVFALDRIQRRRLLAKERTQAQIREAELHAQTAEAQSKALKAENERKELELQKAAELKAAFHELDAAHKNLKATQQQLITQEKLASLGQLTAGIAHEIKNPLNFVNNFAALSVDLMKELNATLTKQKDKLGDEAAAEIDDMLHTLEQNAEKINHHGQRADGIVKSMMQHARGSSGQREPADINHLLDEAVNLVYHGMRANDASFNITIEKEYDSTIGKLEVVPQELSRVFLNLINNACYAAHQKKKDSLDGFSPTLSVSTKNLGDKIEIRIRDNGNGIPAEIREKIFNPFFTTKPTGQGTGLGLSISYDIIVQQHRGEIKVETENGKFAEFVVRLPKHP